MADQQCRPFDRARAVLPNGAIADRPRAAGLVCAEPIGRKLVDQHPLAAQWRAVAQGLARTPEGSVGNDLPIHTQIGDFQIFEGRFRIAAMVDGGAAVGVERDGCADFADRVDRLGIPLKGKAFRHLSQLRRRGKQARRKVVRLRIPRAGEQHLRQTEDRDRHTRRQRKQHALLGRQLAPRIPDGAERKGLLHVGEVGLHLIVDATVTVLPPEIAEVRWEYCHGGNVEEMLEACAHAKLERRAKAAHVRLSYVGIGQDEAHVGGKVIDRVDASAEIVKRAFAQTEANFNDVAGHGAYARRKFVLPYFGLLKSVAQSLEAMLGALGTNQAVHDQSLVLPQQLAQEEAPYEAGRAGQQDLLKVRRRYGRSRRLLDKRCVNGAAQLVHISAALSRQLAD